MGTRVFYLVVGDTVFMIANYGPKINIKHMWMYTAVKMCILIIKLLYKKKIHISLRVYAFV